MQLINLSTRSSAAWFVCQSSARRCGSVRSVTSCAVKVASLIGRRSKTLAQVAALLSPWEETQTGSSRTPWMRLNSSALSAPQFSSTNFNKRISELAHLAKLSARFVANLLSPSQIWRPTGNHRARKFCSSVRSAKANASWREKGLTTALSTCLLRTQGFRKKLNWISTKSGNKIKSCKRNWRTRKNRRYIQCRSLRIHSLRQLNKPWNSLVLKVTYWNSEAILNPEDIISAVKTFHAMFVMQEALGRSMDTTRAMKNATTTDAKIALKSIHIFKERRAKVATVSFTEKTSKLEQVHQELH